MLRWTVAELAEQAKVAPNTVVRFEADKSVNTATIGAIQGALEAAGIEFLTSNAVRLKPDALRRSEPEPDPAPGGFQTQVYPMPRRSRRQK